MRLAFLLPFLLATAPVAAQPPAGGAPSAEALAAALELMPPELIEQQLFAGTMQLIDVIVEEQAEASRRRGEELPAELLRRLRNLLQDENRAVVEAMLPTFRSEAAMIYARHFSVEELRELRRLQQNPVMQRMERLMPQLMAEIGRIGARASAERQPDLERRIAEMVAEWQAEREAGERPPRT